MQSNKEVLKLRSYNFSIDIIKFVSTLSKNSVNRILSDQLLRSATSIGANIVEAQAESSRKDFIKFFEIALKSGNETKYWLGLIKDALDLNTGGIDNLLGECEQLNKILGASLVTLKGKRKI